MRERIVSRYIEATGVTEDLLRAILEKPQPSVIERRIKSLLNAFEWQGMQPFPLSELRSDLIERGAEEEDVDKALKQKPKRKKTLSFYDAYTELGKVTGKSIVFDGAIEHEESTPEIIQAWCKAFKALKPKAKAIFQTTIKKVRLQRPRGSEDASYEHGGVLSLAMRPGTKDPEFIVHEVGHGVEERLNVKTHEPPWGLPPFVSDYAESKPSIEDFAESFRVYILHPNELRRTNLDKFQALQDLIH